jgi:type I restriction enzyme S subunit
MNDWKACTLGDAIELKRGYDLPSSDRDEGSVPIVSSSGISDYHRVAKKMPPGVVTGRYGTIGEVFYVNEPYWPLNTTLYVRNFKRNDPRFVAYFLKVLDIKGLNAAGAVPGVNRNHLHKIKINLPPLPTQRKIAAILSAYDDLIENNQRRIALLEELARETYVEWFVRLRFPGWEGVAVDGETGLPVGWRRVKLEEVAILKKEVVRPGMVDSMTPYIGLEHIPRKSFALTTWETAAKIDSNKYAFKKHDVLFGKIRPYFHKVGVALTTGISSTDAIILRPVSDELHGHVLQTVFTETFVNTATQSSNGTKMPRANWKVLRNFPVVIATSDLLKSYSDLSWDTINAIDNLAAQNFRLREARDLLLPRLMGGLVKV